MSLIDQAARLLLLLLLLLFFLLLPAPRLLVLLCIEQPRPLHPSALPGSECWAQQPSDRPSFDDVVGRLQALLDSAAE